MEDINAFLNDDFCKTNHLSDNDRYFLSKLLANFQIFKQEREIQKLKNDVALMPLPKKSDRFAISAQFVNQNSGASIMLDTLPVGTIITALPTNVPAETATVSVNPERDLNTPPPLTSDMDSFLPMMEATSEDDVQQSLLDYAAEEAETTTKKRKVEKPIGKKRMGGKYKCNLCDNVFGTKKELTRHYKNYIECPLAKETVNFKCPCITPGTCFKDQFTGSAGDMELHKDSCPKYKESQN